MFLLLLYFSEDFINPIYSTPTFSAISVVSATSETVFEGIFNVVGSSNFSMDHDIPSRLIFFTRSRLIEQVSNVSPFMARTVLKNISSTSDMSSRSVKKG